MFREFLKTEYSEENLLFWMACEELRTLDTTDEEVIEDKARTIYEDYISILSPKEVRQIHGWFYNYNIMLCLSLPYNVYI